MKNTTQKIYKFAYNNKNQIDKLPNINVKKVSLNFNTRKTYTVIADDVNLKGGFQKFIEFTGLDNKYLYFIRPFIRYRIDTDAGNDKEGNPYKFDKYSLLTFYYSWEEFKIPVEDAEGKDLKSTTILKIKAYGALRGVTKDEDGKVIDWFSVNTPVFGTIKIQTFTPQLYQTQHGF